MLHLVSGITSLYLFVNLILAPVPPFPTHLFLHPSLFPLLIHDSSITSSFTPGLKPPCFTNPTPVVSLLPPGLPSRTIVRTVCSELLRFSLVFLFFSFLCRAPDQASHLVSFSVHVNIPYHTVSTGGVALCAFQTNGPHLFNHQCVLGFCF